jgi:hypothetical protein
MDEFPLELVQLIVEFLPDDLKINLNEKEFNAVLEGKYTLSFIYSQNLYDRRFKCIDFNMDLTPLIMEFVVKLNLSYLKTVFITKTSDYNFLGDVKITKLYQMKDCIITYPLSLKKLVITNYLDQDLRNLRNLEILSLHSKFGGDFNYLFPKNLKVLNLIFEFDNLKLDLPNLKVLTIQNSTLFNYKDLPPSVEELNFKNFDDMEVVPILKKRLLNLKKLTINNIPIQL